MTSRASNKTPRVAVIGAGPAGMAAAYKLTQNQISTDIFEGSAQVGGLARTIELWNQKVDLGPHRFFTKDQRVKSFWSEIIEDSYVTIPRLTRILYQGSFFRYPLEAVDVLRNMPVKELFHCVSDYAFREKAKNESADASIEEWLISRFGSRLYEIFFKDYTEKLWGLKCTDISADFAKQRIKDFNLYEAIVGALQLPAKKNHRTITDSFAYPTHGAGQLYDKARVKIEKNQGRFFFNSRVQSIQQNPTTRKYVLRGEGIEPSEYDFVLSTMPLTHLVQALGAQDQTVNRHARQLSFRSTILVYLKINHPNLFPDNWLYVNSPDLATGRITNFRNWSPALYNDSQASILSMEYWCQKDDAIWSLSDDLLIEKAKSELLKTSLCAHDLIEAGFVYRIEKSYPVYKREYLTHLEPIQKYLNTFNGIQALGRYGSFKYNNQDHSILMGLLAAENIISGSRHDLWSVNSDTEEYHESHQANIRTK